MWVDGQLFCMVFSDQETSKHPPQPPSEGTYACPAGSRGAPPPGDSPPGLRSAGPCGWGTAGNTRTCLRRRHKEARSGAGTHSSDKTPSPDRTTSPPIWMLQEGTNPKFLMATRGAVGTSVSPLRNRDRDPWQGKAGTEQVPAATLLPFRNR